MNSKVFLVIIMAIVGVAVLGLSIKPQSSSAESGPPNSVVGTSSLSSQTQTAGVVSVEATPKTLTSGQDVIFDLVLNNHSVDLGYDFAAISTLTDSTGHTYPTKQWTGNSGGHHVRGQLIFPALMPNAKSITFTLTGVDNQTISFSWNL